MPTRFVTENEASRARLRESAGRLSARDLTRPAAAGWTVAATLAHLAFWDFRALVLVRRWRASQVSASPVDDDAINDACKELCLALAPRKAVELCLRAAEEVDRELESVDDALEHESEEQGGHVRFNRAMHRNTQLDELERLMGERT